MILQVPTRPPKQTPYKKVWRFKISASHHGSVFFPKIKFQGETFQQQKTPIKVFLKHLPEMLEMFLVETGLVFMERHKTSNFRDGEIP